MTPKPIIMVVDPAHFNVSYVINPWMKPGDWAADPAGHQRDARASYDALRAALSAAGAHVEAIPGVPGQPDMVFPGQRRRGAGRPRHRRPLRLRRAPGRGTALPRRPAILRRARHAGRSQHLPRKLLPGRRRRRDLGHQPRAFLGRLRPAQHFRRHRRTRALLRSNASSPWNWQRPSSTTWIPVSARSPGARSCSIRRRSHRKRSRRSTRTPRATNVWKRAPRMPPPFA